MEVDTFASALKAGERPDCNGLVLVVGWSWGSQDKGYQQLASEMRTLDASHTLVYDGEYTHCTCATLSRYARSDAAQSRYCCSSAFVNWTEHMYVHMENVSPLRCCQNIFFFPAEQFAFMYRHTAPAVVCRPRYVCANRVARQSLRSPGRSAH